MNNLKMMAISAVALAFAACDSGEVQMVKNGSLNSCPDKTVEEMVNGYMGNPQWESGIGKADGKDYVNVKGEISYNNEPATAEIQFLLNKEKSSFQLNAWKLNGKPAPDIVAVGLFNKMCNADLEAFAKELLAATQEMSKMKSDMSAFESEMENMQKCKPESGSSKSEGQEILEIATCLEKNVKNQEFIQKIAQPMKKVAGLMVKMESLPKEKREVVEKFMEEDPLFAAQKAKSSASIISPTMKMFKDLLEIYVIEGNPLSPWQKIGFVPPSSTTFAIEEINSRNDETITVEGIRMTNLIPLANCPAGSSWILQCSLDQGKYTCNCSVTSAAEEACLSITPNFKRICEI